MNLGTYWGHSSSVYWAKTGWSQSFAPYMFFLLCYICQVSSTSTRYQVFGTRYQVLGTRYQVQLVVHGQIFSGGLGGFQLVYAVLTTSFPASFSSYGEHCIGSESLASVLIKGWSFK